MPEPARGLPRLRADEPPARPRGIRLRLRDRRRAADRCGGRDRAWCHGGAGRWRSVRVVGAAARGGGRAELLAAPRYASVTTGALHGFAAGDGWALAPTRPGR